MSLAAIMTLKFAEIMLSDDMNFEITGTARQRTLYSCSALN